MSTTHTSSRTRRTLRTILTAGAVGALIAAPSAVASAGTVSPQGVCGGEAIFEVLSSESTFTKVGETQHNINNTASTQSATFSSQTSGTVSVSSTATISGGISTAFAKIEASVGVTASESLTVTTGNSTTVDVPPNSTAYAEYGANTITVRGKSYTLNNGCNPINVTYPTITAPTSVGWKTY